MKILIIEDDASIRQTLQDLLEIHGHEVLAAPDGPTGIRLAAERPELILCDVGLPGLDGYQVLQALRRLPQGQETPFIFLTARTERQEQRRGMALGADDYITKPFTEKEILEAISARVGRQRPLRERIDALVRRRDQELAAEWSHELMTPLTGILGGLDLLESDAGTATPEEIKELVALIRAGATRQYRLSRKLIRYFDLERQLQRHHPAAELACDAVTTIAAGAAQAGQQERRLNDLQVQCEAGQLPVLENQLIDAVAELVENALHFSAPGQLVELSGTRVDGRYLITVTDQGPGMTAEQRAQAGPFKQFGRKHHEQQGLGLGLAIAQVVAELGGGQLRLEEGPQGRGLRAVLDLPAA